MTHYKSLVDTNYLGQWDLGNREATVVMSKVERYKPQQKRKLRLPDGSYAPEQIKRIVIHFSGKRKPWLAGPTSLKTIATLYGSDIEGWVGKQSTIYVDAHVEFGGAVVGGIRVRPVAPKAGTKPTDDPLDRPVDQEKAEHIDKAAGRQPGEEG